ncbi:hypothetical protein EYF80_057813 [Liparis tanakae]|uniref:Uncharacterized protein n=1 Tax=Liparis tanakae TaxID=230148 RepID=A0A4Z2ETC4_9TELE|nr:hypothetical protein EYF80_057813 [Liparis tanakae]
MAFPPERLEKRLLRCRCHRHALLLKTCSLTHMNAGSALSVLRVSDTFTERPNAWDSSPPLTRSDFRPE